MFKVIKNVIETKNFELSNMLVKIDTMWVQGSISDAERTELIAAAQGNAKLENSIDLARKVTEIDKRLLEVEAILKALEEEGEESDPETEPEAAIPEYVAGKWYYSGDKVTFDGSTYTCVAPEGVVCTWSPLEYPVYWEIVI